MSNVNQAFIKAYRDRARPSEPAHQPETAEDGLQTTKTPLQQAQVSLVVGIWNSSSDPALDHVQSAERPFRRVDQPEAEPLLKPSLRLATHLPAVLAATAASAAERVDHEQDLEPVGVEYERPFIPLPQSEQDPTIPFPQARKSVDEPGGKSAENPRATVIFDAQQSATIPQPHFDVTAVSETADQQVTTPEPAPVAENETTADTQVPDNGEFRPAWEVDSFSWPRNIGQLFEGQPDRFDPLVTHIVQLADEGTRRFAVVGCSEGCGATFLTLCLARRISEVVQRVAVVDGNLGTPSLAKQLDICLDAGWEDVLAGKQMAEEAAVASLARGITLLPLMQAGTALFDKAAAERATSVIEKLVRSHDIVLVDAGLVGAGGHKSVLADGQKPAADAAILVCDCRRPTQPDVAAAVDELKRRGITVVAVAENFRSAGDSRAAA